MSRDQIDNTPTSTNSSASSIAIRDADERDLLAVNAIFNREITESAYVYAEVPITLDDRRAWLQMHRSANLPVLVATDPGDANTVLGWASLSPYRAASGYRFTLEASVYVQRGSHRRGIGRQLLATLDSLARARGTHAIVASIDSGNTPSIVLFERFGYIEAARLTDVGRKFDQWRTQLLLLKIY